MNADGTGQFRLTNNAATEEYPAWSPDGSKIAFDTNRDGNPEIYVMNADGTGQTNISNSNPAFDGQPCWSPDGTKIAFFSDRDGTPDIYTMNADGSGVVRLTTNPAFDTSPSWSPDGSKIAFVSNRDGNNELYSMNSDGTNQKRLTNNAAFDYYPVWSPDSTKLAFTSDRDGNYEVYTMNADGTNPTRITNDPATDQQPSWSADGNKLIFNSFRDGNGEIYSMTYFGALQTNLTKLPGKQEFQPSWSGYLPRTPKTLIGAGGTLGANAAGFIYAQNGDAVTSVVAFDTTPATRSAARIVAQTASETQSSNLVFAITTSAGLTGLSYASVNEAGVPAAAVSPTLPSGSTNALVTLNASTGLVSTVLPYAANRSASLKPMRSGDQATYTGNFTAIFNGEGKNLAPNGAHSVTLDEATGKLVRFQ